MHTPTVRTHTDSPPAVTDAPVTAENEFKIVSKLSSELIVAWPLFMKRVKAKRLAEEKSDRVYCACALGCNCHLAAGAATPGRLESSARNTKGECG